MKTKAKNEWVPEYKYETLSGKFEDYRGIERDFTMVAVSIPMSDEDVVVTRPVEYEDEYIIPAKNVLNEETGEIEYVPATVDTYTDVVDEVLAPVAKMLTIGVAVRCVRDKDRGLGTRIAYGKAVTLLNHTLYVSHSGMINTKMVQALLAQEAEHFKKDPGAYITGYNADKARYLETGKIAEAEMTEDELKAYKLGKNIKATKQKKNSEQKSFANKETVKDRILKEANSEVELS